VALLNTAEAVLVNPHNVAPISTMTTVNTTFPRRFRKPRQRMTDPNTQNLLQEERLFIMCGY
jgi:hypothetical protein